MRYGKHKRLRTRGRDCEARDDPENRGKRNSLSCEKEEVSLNFDPNPDPRGDAGGRPGQEVTWGGFAPGVRLWSTSSRVIAHLPAK